MSPAEFKRVMAKHAALRSELGQTGELLNGAGVADPAETKAMRLRANEPLTADGPLYEAPLHLSSYYVLKCAGLDRALEIAQTVLDSHVEAVEVRRIHDSAGMDR
jgi:hypothetical protein